MGDVVIGNPTDGYVCSMTTSDQLVVMLPVNPSTGFRWTAEARGDLVSAGMSERTQGSPGGGSPRGFVFRALRTGTAELAFKLWRPWEGDASTIQRIGITVTITPQQ
ncbi:protease inhibitor I42 family protein [Arthrobacter oryzae]|uniref:Putative secreted protein n=1 Tax=Arthrobacter oryzae TaxID=409290 RepID=A0A495ECS6_9MICC|nr:putative secreted protein [Arthrobacter oryzae]